MELRATEYETVGRTALITLNRPHRGNAWTGRLDAELRWCLQTADKAAEVRVIVVTGAGQRFCVGGDSQALQSHADKGQYDNGLGDALSTGGADVIAQPGYGLDKRFDAPFASHFGLSKPLIAAINGAAAGIGLALACFTDLRFASTGAKLTTAHGKLGLPAEYGLSWILPRLVGVTRAMDILLTSRVVLAEEALDIGLINQVHPPENLLAATLEYAEQLASSVSAGSLLATRRQVYRDLHSDVGQSVADSVQLLEEMMGGDEYKQGVRALLNKEPPNF